MTGPRRLTTRTQILDVGEGHRYLRWEVPVSFSDIAYAVQSPSGWAVAVPLTSPTGRAFVACLGDGATLERLLTDPDVRDGLATRDDVVSVSVPLGLASRLHPLLDVTDRGGDWEWMSTTTVPPTHPLEERVEAVGAQCRAELTAFLTAHSPRTHGQPFARADQLWAVVRDNEGSLLATGCGEPNGAGWPHLAGIATHPAARGQGLASAVTSWLQREAVARTGVCTLGMYADNDVARRVYHALGFTTDIAWATREVARPS